MLLKRVVENELSRPFTTAPSVARTLDPIVTGASLRESRFPISMS